MKVWILIYWFRVFGNDGVVDSIEFKTLKECQSSASKIKEHIAKTDYSRFLCLEKTK